MYYLCQHSLSVLGKYLAQNSDTFKLSSLYKTNHNLGRLGYIESNFLHGSLHFVGIGIIYSEKS